VITIRGLRKSYGTDLVLDGIDLTVAGGTVFALLGPNGAGKTTMVEILSTLLPADAGEVTIGGYDLVRQAGGIRRLIGVTGQYSAVDDLFTGEENLLLMADLHHLPKRDGRRRAAELLERFDLVEAARKPSATYSGGMRRRLDLAMTLMGDPRLVFLDEPTTGLDPRSRRTMWQIVRDLVAGGVTIFLTTQALDEADELADHVAVLDRGRIVAEGTPDELKRKIVVQSKDVQIVPPAPGSAGDPRCNGDPVGTVKARLHVVSASSGESHETPLPCQNWVQIGSPTSPKGFKYKDREQDDGTAKSVTWKAKNLKATLTGKGPTTLGYDLQVGVDEAPVAARFQSGNVSVCLQCTAHNGKNGSDGKQFLGKTLTCPAPSGCLASPSGAFLD